VKSHEIKLLVFQALNSLEVRCWPKSHEGGLSESWKAAVD